MEAYLSNLTVFNHPLIKHKVSHLCDVNTGTKEFSELVKELAMLMGYETLKELKTKDVEVQAPLQKIITPVLAEDFTIVPILRAGLGMVDGMLQLVPSAKVGHIGLYRDHDTLQPVEYYNKLPSDIEERDVIVLDPMLATGGSAMDAGKVMWMLYENPDADFSDMSMDFMDIRKRVYTFPKMGKKAYFVAIPTSSGTGSEVTPFAIITDQDTGVKWPLADYELLPDMAIVDTNNMMSAPKGLTRASGIDVMTHAIEAYVSMMASDYTDGLALKAIKLVFEYLPRAYKDGNDVEARDHMANASCMAGLAFANAFLGVNHSLAHKLGAFHHLPHGIANAVVLLDVMRYNSAEVPTKMGTFPQYQYPKTLARYAEIGRSVGLTGKNDAEVFEKLLAKLDELMRTIEILPTIRDYGVDEKYFLETLDEMSEQAFNDQCTGANPRYPLVSELKDIYLKAYYGEMPNKERKKPNKCGTSF